MADSSGSVDPILIAAGTLQLAAQVGIPLHPPPPPAGGMKFMFRSHTGLFLAAKPSSLLHQATLVLEPLPSAPSSATAAAAGPSPLDRFKWTLVAHVGKPGVWSLRSCDGRYVRATDYAATPFCPSRRCDTEATAAGEWEALQLAVHGADGCKLVFRCLAHGTLLVPEHTGKAVSGGGLVNVALPMTAPEAGWTVCGSF